MLKIILTTISISLLFACSKEEIQQDSNTDLQIVKAFPKIEFERPIDIQNVGDNRLFVAEQKGRIHVFENKSDISSTTVFLDIEDIVDDRSNEEGLLGLAFHPNYTTNGYFYLNYTRDDSKTVIARFTVSKDKNKADKGSQHILLTFDQPYGNHNGGQIAFGPDGFLYIAVGDGGAGGDPKGHGQNRETLLGNILRIDVDNPSHGKNYGIPKDNPYINHPSFKKEIYAYGMRNPWRMSFDSKTGKLWTGDVGQNAYEEIDIIENGKNYGWNLKEGTHDYKNPDNISENLEDPIYEYGRRVGGSISGGLVYRGAKLKSLYGWYLYADFVSQRLWKLRQTEDGKIENVELTQDRMLIPTFGVDKDNEVYFGAFDGFIYKFVGK